MKTFLFSFLIFISLIFNAQTNLDSLWGIWNDPSQTDTNRLKAIGGISWEFIFSDPDSALYLAQLQYKFAKSVNHKKYICNAYNLIGISYNLKSNYIEARNYFNKVLNISKELNFKNAIASSFNNIGITYEKQSEYYKALDYYDQSLIIRKEINDQIGVAGSLGNIAAIHHNLGNYKEALNNYQKSIKIKKQINDLNGIAGSYNNIGIVYFEQKNYEEALHYYRKSLEIQKEFGNKVGIAACYNNIGGVLKNQGNYNEALHYFQECLKINKNLGSLSGISDCYSNIGQNLGLNEDYEAAQLYFQKSLKISEEIGDKQDIADAYYNIGSNLKVQGYYLKALPYLKNSLDLTQKIGALDKLDNYSKALYEVYKQLGVYNQALLMLELLMETKDTLKKINAIEEGIRLEVNRKYNEKQLADSLQHENEKNIIKVKHDSEMDQEENKRYFLYGGLVLFLVFSVFIFNRFIITRKQKQIIEKQKDVVEIQKQEVEKQKLVVEDKNKEIIDSITYAKRLQNSILPQSSTIEKLFPESFVLFKPKDIVSGDFYWAKESKGKHLLAAVDCTGHGVPGAFMSLIGANGLNDAVEKHQLNDPGAILNELNRSAHQAMNKGDDNVNVRDGMDISLCAIDYINLKLFFSGAVNPIYHIRNNELNIIKGDRYAVGSFTPSEKTYNTHEISLLKGDIIYLFSDGYADQFGGLKGKKYMYKKFRETLLSIHSKKLEEQKKSLQQTLDVWMGSYKQIDDILVIGIRI